MPEYDNTNSGVLFRNDKKTSEKAPEYTGKINVDGVDKEIAAWVKESKAGKKFFSIKVSEPYKKEESSSTPADDDSEIPF